MLRIERILFPTDFTEVAERAFQHASHLADRFGADLHVLNVVPPNKPEFASPMEYLTENRLAEANANAIVAERPGVHMVHRQVEDSSPAIAVLGYADEQDVDLIVMGTHGRRGLDRWFIGSVAEEVMRLATTPVMTVQPTGSASGADFVERILVPVDFSEHSRLSITYARELAASYGARIDLVHIVEDLTVPAIYGLDLKRIDTPEVLDRVRVGLETMIEEAPGADVSIRPHVIYGHPVREILGFAESNKSDLMVIATHGLTGIRRFLMGSVTERLSRVAPCPVFTIKSFGKQLITGLHTEGVGVR